jgi:hypothetical protein
MLTFVLLFLKRLLVPLHASVPTAEEIQAHEDYEEARACYGQYPSPQEAYRDAVDWRDGMTADYSLYVLLRWRLSVAWMPGFPKRRLLGERCSRWLRPDLHRMHRAHRKAVS